MHSVLIRSELPYITLQDIIPNKSTSNCQQQYSAFKLEKFSAGKKL